MREIDLSVPPQQLLIWLVPLSIVMLVMPMLPYLMANGGYLDSNGNVTIPIPWIIIPLLMVMIIAHEAVHAIAWKYASNLPWSEFEFGFAWKALAPYCHVKAPVSVQAYRIGVYMPAIVTGLIPLGISYALNSPSLILVSSMLISAAVGDMYMLWTIRNVPDNAQIIDHASNMGCIVLIPESTER